MDKNKIKKPIIAAMALIVAASTVPWNSLTCNVVHSRAAEVSTESADTDDETEFDEDEEDGETEDSEEENSDESETESSEPDDDSENSDFEDDNSEDDDSESEEDPESDTDVKNHLQFEVSNSAIKNNEITYSVEKFDNTGGIYYYNSGYILNLDDKTSLKALNIGQYENANDITVLYKVGTLSEAGDAYATEDFEVIDDEDIAEDGTVKLPELGDNERIDAVYIQYNIIDDKFKMTKPITITVSIDDKASSYVATSRFVGIIGDAADPNNPTNSEFDSMKEVFIANTLTAETSDAVLSAGKITVSSDTIKYREAFSYNIGDISNMGTSGIQNMTLTIGLSDRVRFRSMSTPIFDGDFSYSVFYNTSADDTLKVLESNISSATSKELLPPELGLDEYINKIVIVAENFPMGAKNTSDITINCINWSDPYDSSPVTTTMQITGKIEDGTIEGEVQSASYSSEIPESVQANIERSNEEVVIPNQNVVWTYQNVLNSTGQTVEDFILSETFTKDIQPSTVYTGTYNMSNADGKTYSIVYQLSTDDEDTWHSLAKDLDFGNVSEISFSELEDDSYITEVRFLYGTVNSDFTAIECPQIDVTVSEGVEYNANIKTETSLNGIVNGEEFVESKQYVSKAVFGWVQIEAYDIDTGKQIKEISKMFGSVGDDYNIEEFDIPGYRYVKSEGANEGVFKEGLTDTVKVYYKVLPKTGESPVNNTAYPVAASILTLTGTAMFVKKNWRRKEFI